MGNRAGLTFQDYASRPWGDIIQPSIDLRYKLIEGKWSLRAFYRLEIPITMTGDVATAHYAGVRLKTYVCGMEIFWEPFLAADDGQISKDPVLTFASRAGVSVPLKGVLDSLKDFSATAEWKSTYPLWGGEKTVQGWENAAYIGITYSHNFGK